MSVFTHLLHNTLLFLPYLFKPQLLSQIIQLRLMLTFCLFLFHQLQNGEQGSDEGDNQPFSDDDIPSDVDMNDPYFREEMENLGVKGKNKDNKRKKRGSDLDENEEEKQGKVCTFCRFLQHFIVTRTKVIF